MKSRDVGEPLEDVPGDVALERAHCFALGLSLAGAAVEVGASFGLVLGADERDGVDRVVDLAVAAAVQAVADGLAGRRWQGRDPLQRAKAASCMKRVGSEGEQLGG